MVTLGKLLKCIGYETAWPSMRNGRRMYMTSSSPAPRPTVTCCNICTRYRTSKLFTHAETSIVPPPAHTSDTPLCTCASTQRIKQCQLVRGPGGCMQGRHGCTASPRHSALAQGSQLHITNIHNFLSSRPVSYTHLTLPTILLV